MITIRHVSLIGSQECPCGICSLIIERLERKGNLWDGGILVLSLKKMAVDSEEWLYR